MRYDVSVIGLGRIGLPLALSFADSGLSVLGVDTDQDRLQAIRERRMPFKEPGTDELIARVALDSTSRAADAAQARAIVLTLGTPAMSHIEIDIRDIRTVLDDLLPHLREDHLIVLRSTVAPGTTEFVAGYLEKHRGFRVGEDIFVAHVPERIAADKFMEEISTLPCIIGGVGEVSGERAAQLFEPLGAPVFQTTPVQAELAKIWTNILRYATFALPNLLMMDCERHGANVFDVIELINRDYPRGGMAHARASPPARACARTSRSARSARARPACCSRSRACTRPSRCSSSTASSAGSAAACANARSPCSGLASSPTPTTSAIRSSHKLIRLLERELADVAVHDPVVATPTSPFEEAVTGADVIVVATNHSAYSTPEALRSIAELAPDALLVDPWNALGTAQVFAYVAEVAALRA